MKQKDFKIAVFAGDGVGPEIIKEALKKYKKIGLGFSGGTDSLVLLHLTLPLMPTIPTVFVDTQHEFVETYDFIDECDELIFGFEFRIEDIQKEYFGKTEIIR